MPTIDKTCCFTGHRPKHFTFGTDETHPECIRIKKFLHQACERLIMVDGVTHFISGGTLGVDTWAMEEVIALKRRHPGITLECALTYAAMPDRFNPRDRARHAAAIKDCDSVTAVSPAYDGRACLDRCNEYMVDSAAYLIAVWTGIMTGTGRTVQYAKKMNRQIFLLNPSASKDEAAF